MQRDAQGLRILISGIGIAGPVAAYWLLKGNPNHSITIIERSADIRTAGQSIDIRQSAVDIIKRMGLEDGVRSKTTSEHGIEFVDETGCAFATFLATGDSAQQSFTSEYEIFRGDLVQLCYDTVEDRVESVFGDYVTDCYQEDSGQTRVDFANGRESEVFDLVIAADGQSSKLRQIALDTLGRPREHWYTFNNFCAYFTLRTNDLPGALLDDRTLASWYNSTQGRALFLRPDPTPGQCRANIIRQLLDPDIDNINRYREALSKGNAAVQQLLKEDFADAGWVSKQVLEGMEGADDFYASEAAQIRPPVLYKDRIVLVGDAAHCATPLTGMGTSLAIIGAYVLAGEVTSQLSGDEGDLSTALRRYNDVMLPYSRKVQNVPRWIPQWLNPQSGWGLTISRSFLWLTSASGIVPLISRITGATAIGKDTFQLPPYAFD